MKKIPTPTAVDDQAWPLWPRVKHYHFASCWRTFMELKKYILCAYCFIAGIGCKKCFIFEQCLEILCDVFVCLF